MKTWSKWIFMIVLMSLGLTSCNSKGLCEDPIEWKLESVSSDDVVVTPWKKIKNEELQIEISATRQAGKVVFVATNKYEIFFQGLSVDGNRVEFDTPSYKIKEYETQGIRIKIEKSVLTLDFSELNSGELPKDMLLYVASLEVGTQFHIVRQ